MKRAIIFINGDLSDLKNAKQNIKSEDLIICADGASEKAVKLDLIPNVIIGDLDSIPAITREKLKKHQIKWVRFQREKDESDSELASNYAVEHGYKEIIFFGLLGTRLDHMLSNISHLEVLARKGINAKIIEGNKEIYVTINRVRIIGRIGEPVSIIPLKNDAKNVTTNGLKYKLSDEDLSFGYSKGISNLMTQKEAEISIKNGSLLIIHAKH